MKSVSLQNYDETTSLKGGTSLNRRIGIIGSLAPMRNNITVDIMKAGRIVQPIRGLRLICSGAVTIRNYTFDVPMIMWDTGATESAVFLKDPIRKICSDPEDRGLIWTATRSLDEVLYYPGKIDILGKISVSLSWIDVIDAQPEFADVILGMDVISKGKLTVCDEEFSFEV